MKRFMVIFIVMTTAMVMGNFAALSQQSGSTSIAGGGGGNSFIDPQPAAGTRVTEVRIRSGQMIDAIQMVYASVSGSSVAAAQHGGSGGRVNIFRLDADEYIIGISGRCGDIIDSLRIHTNKKTSPLYGGSGGNRDYQIEVPGGTEALGFIGRSGQRLDAIGLTYTALSLRSGSRYIGTSVGQVGAVQYQQTQLFGGGGGYPFSAQDIPAGARIAEIRITSSDRVDSLQVIYVLTDGRTIEGTRYGSSIGRQRIFRLDADEYITGISGRYSTVINSLQIQTNKKPSPLYGGPGGDNSYQAVVPNGYQAAGFAGRSSALIDAIALTYTPLSQNLGVGPFGQVSTSQYSQTQIFGGGGGYPILAQSIPAGARIAEIRISASDRVDSLQAIYVLTDGRTVEGTRYGSSIGRQRMFRLDADEYITSISGRYSTVINSLQIQTNKKTSPLYGGPGGDNSYQAIVPDGYQAAGFAGRSSALIDAIGLTYTPLSQSLGGTTLQAGTGQYAQTQIYGGGGGYPFSAQDIPAGARVAEIRITASDRIDSLQTIYVLADGRTVEGTRYGNAIGRQRIFRLDADEYITSISGRYSSVVNSLQIQTSKKASPLYGGTGGTDVFQIAVPTGSQVVGFAGRSSALIDAIGLAHTQLSRGTARRYGQGNDSRQVAQAGTVQYQQTQLYGGSGGSPFADEDIPAGARISEIRIASGDRVDSVQVIYVLSDGRTMEGTRYGGTGGRFRSFRLDADEYVTGISGRYGVTIDSLQIRTNKKTSPLYGGSGGTTNFQIDVPTGSQAVGFVGRAGQYLDAVGLVHARIGVWR